MSGQCSVMVTTLTPQKAADRARVGRSSIMRALESGNLKAIRNNKGRWQITPEALNDWLSMRPDAPDRSNDRQSPPMTADTPETLIKLAVAEARLTDAQTAFTEMRADRDAWRAQAELGFWQRIWGSRSPK